MTSNISTMIRVRLAEYALKNSWVIRQLGEKGINVDSALYSSILSGTRKGNLADKVLKESVALLDEYDEIWNGRKSRNDVE